MKRDLSMMHELSMNWYCSTRAASCLSVATFILFDSFVYV